MNNYIETLVRIMNSAGFLVQEVEDFGETADLYVHARVKAMGVPDDPRNYCTNIAVYVGADAVEVHRLGEVLSEDVRVISWSKYEPPVIAELLRTLFTDPLLHFPPHPELENAGTHAWYRQVRALLADYGKHYANVWWSVDDIVDADQEGLRPDWKTEKAAAFLTLVEDDVVAAMVQAGREELETLLTAYEDLPPWTGE